MCNITNIPGVNNLDIEFFTTDFNDCYKMSDNNIVQFEDFDGSTLDLLVDDKDKEPLIDIRLEAAGIHKPLEKLKRFTICRHGAFNDRPDFNSSTGEFEDTEFLRCGHHGNCPFKLEGIMCHQMKVKNGILTRSELNYIKFSVMDLADKQIACLAGRETNTIKKHRQNATQKIGCASKVGLGVFGAKNNIEFPQDHQTYLLTKIRSYALNKKQAGIS